MKKLIVAISLISVIALSLCSCSGSQKTQSVSVYDLKNAMAAATAKFDAMSYASSEDEGAQSVFANVSEMNYSKVEAFCVYYATNGTGNADEIAIIEVKNASDLTEARESLEAHLEKRKSLYSTYDKSQLKKLEAAKIAVNGRCVALVVADDAEKIVEAFNAYFETTAK